jgi:eukaryotic-like serine/threonine-protein kinase
MNLLDAIALHLPRGYTIARQIGAGATSFVYLARHNGDGSTGLVVKVMRPGTVNAESVDRFLREAQLLKKLDHPRIIPILEAGEAQGAVFFTMPYLAGETLHDRIQREGRLPVRDVLLVARDVSDALGYAHSKGVVHRDVKPANVLLTSAGAYLMDFGFANAPGAAVFERGPGAVRYIVGTPDYVSPEQVAGQRAEDWRSDFFSLGCVMFEMLIGKPPFRAESPRATMMRRLKYPAADVRMLRSDLPPAVAAIVNRNLDLHPSNRFPFAGSLSAALDAALAELDAPVPEVR